MSNWLRSSLAAYNAGVISNNNYQDRLTIIAGAVEIIGVILLILYYNYALVPDYAMILGWIITIIGALVIFVSRNNIMNQMHLPPNYNHVYN